MHIQSHFAQSDLQALHELIQAHPLGALVMQGPQGLEVNHMPFLLLPQAGERGVLQAHVPLGNVIRTFAEQEAVVLFQGPQAYVSPSWYASKRVDGKAVPTWNYIVVHAYGRPRFIRDKAWLLQHLAALTTRHEAAMAEPWRMDDAPPDYLAKRLEQIVGVEMPITRLAGKWKASQNRPGDRAGIADALDAAGTDESRAMAALVRAHGNAANPGE
jgi:transcriptional regulator